MAAWWRSSRADDGDRRSCCCPTLRREASVGRAAVAFAGGFSWGFCAGAISVALPASRMNPARVQKPCAGAVRAGAGGDERVDHAPLAAAAGRMPLQASTNVVASKP